MSFWDSIDNFFGGIIDTVRENPVKSALAATMTVGAGAVCFMTAPVIAAIAGGAGLLGATATTGTAISTLSGAALTNASLAAIGGGALSAGGAGMAGGTVIVTGAGAVVGGVATTGGAILVDKTFDE